jgi:hypothetical protein
LYKYVAVIPNLEVLGLFIVVDPPYPLAVWTQNGHSRAGVLAKALELWWCRVVMAYAVFYCHSMGDNCSMNHTPELLLRHIVCDNEESGKKLISSAGSSNGP